LPKLWKTTKYLKRCTSIHNHKYIIDFTYQILGITCDNASNNDTMVESLATIMSHFSGEANRARCLAHIVNLVAKIILRQFDMTKKKKKKNESAPELPVPNDTGDNDTTNEMPIVDEKAEDSDDFDEEMDRVLDKEEKEMDEGDDEDNEESEKLERDAEIMEKAMEDEIERVAKKVKPVRQSLYKVSSSSFFITFLLFFLLPPWPSFLLLYTFNSALYVAFKSPSPFIFKALTLLSLFPFSLRLCLFLFAFLFLLPPFFFTSAAFYGYAYPLFPM
jgi:hypothetical protein